VLHEVGIGFGGTCLQCWVACAFDTGLNALDILLSYH